MSININNMQWGFNGQPPPQNFNNFNFIQEIYQICVQHPSCIDCPYVGQPVQMKDAVQICEIGINKQKQKEEENNNG